MPEQRTAQTETELHHAGSADWFSRSGTMNHRTGVQMVHPDSANDRLIGPLQAPLWYPKNELLLVGEDVSAGRAERNERLLWVRKVHGRALRDTGLGNLANDPGSSPIVQYFRTLPPELTKQRNVMQCLRGDGLTNRYTHQVDVALVAGLIATHAGLSRHMIEHATLTALVHDIGHFAFAHSSELAIRAFLGEMNPNETVPYDHADASGLVLAGFNWDPQNKNGVAQMIYAVSNHSWALRHGTDQLGGYAADLAGAADRISYSITDLLDAVAIGRVRWEDLPEIVPQSFALARFTRDDVQELMEMGPIHGSPVLQERLRNAYVTEVGGTLRETHIVGLYHGPASALEELRGAGSLRLHQLPAHKAFELKMFTLALNVLRELNRDAERDGYGERSPQEAIRRYAQLDEPQVIVFAERRKIALSILVDVREGEKESVPFVPRDVTRIPFIVPDVAKTAMNRPDRRATIMSIQSIVPASFTMKDDMGRNVVLDTVDIMDMLGLLSARGRGALVMRCDHKPGTPVITLPPTEGQRRALAEQLSEPLEAGLRDAVARYDQMTGLGEPAKPSVLAAQRSLGYLVGLFRESDGDPVKTLTGYMDRYSEWKRPAEPELDIPLEFELVLV